MAMGQKPVPPVNIPIPTKIGPKMGGEFTYPKLLPLVLTTTAKFFRFGGRLARQKTAMAMS